MNGPGALLVTAGVLLFAAMALGGAAAPPRPRNHAALTRAAWCMFALACAAVIGSAWWQVGVSL